MDGARTPEAAATVEWLIIDKVFFHVSSFMPQRNLKVSGRVSQHCSCIATSGVVGDVFPQNGGPGV